MFCQRIELSSSSLQVIYYMYKAAKKLRQEYLVSFPLTAPWRHGDANVAMDAKDE